MRFELFVATRYLRAKRRQAVIGVITGISIAGVAAGVASLIIALAINNGFRQDLQERLLSSTSHIILMRVQGDGIQDWGPLMERLARGPHVVAAAPAIYEKLLISRGARADGAVLKGIIPSYEQRVSDMLRSITLGSIKDLEPESSSTARYGNQEEVGRSASDAKDGVAQGQKGDRSVDSLGVVDERVRMMPPIVLGKDMAADLGATIGSVVLVTSPQGELTPFGMVPKYTNFRVVGIFNSGFYDYDSAWAFTRLSDAQQLFGLGNLISAISFKVDDIYKAPELARRIEQTAGHGFMTSNWEDQDRALFHALRLERLVTFITIGLIVFVAALNILISLTMMVMEKTKDIAVLMSMGTRSRQVRGLFMTQGVLIGVIGTLLGLVIGYGLALAGSHYHLIPLDPQVYSIDYVPFAPRAVDGILVSLVAIGISFIATLYPSWSAARILPAEALRYE